MTRSHTIAVVLLTLASLGALACLLVDFPGGDTVFGVLSFAFPPALIAVGASRDGRLGRLAAPLLLIAVLLEACVLAMLLLPQAADPGAYWLGLPPATAVMLYGLWLSPLLLVALVYAWHFQRFGLREEDLVRIRRLSNRRNGED